MAKATDTTQVMFRMGKGNDLFALFPEVPGDNAGNFCMSYQHVGQHSAADFYGCVRTTRPATPEEYKDLEAELVSIGYDLKVIKRASYTLHEARRKEARR
jgi:hypothetical protein